MTSMWQRYQQGQYHDFIQHFKNFYEAISYSNNRPASLCYSRPMWEQTPWSPGPQRATPSPTSPGIWRVSQVSTSNRWHVGTSLQLVSQVYKFLSQKLKCFKVRCQVKHKLHKKTISKEGNGKDKMKAIQETKDTQVSFIFQTVGFWWPLAVGCMVAWDMVTITTWHRYQRFCTLEQLSHIHVWYWIYNHSSSW